MALQTFFTQLKKFFSRSTQKKDEPVFEPAYAGETVYGKLEAKAAFWKTGAAKKAKPLTARIPDAVAQLKHGVAAIANATPAHAGPHERIAEEHQRAFAAKAETIHRQLSEVVFPSDFDGLSSAQERFSSLLSSMNANVKDNRYIYAFFERDVPVFNAAMKELLDVDAKLHGFLEPVRAFERQRLALEKKRVDSALSSQLERLRREKNDAQTRLIALQHEKNALPVFDASAATNHQQQLNAAKAEEQRHANRFYSALEALEGPLKKYARGKDPGAYADVAEKYLRVKEDFLKDCLLDSEDLEPLLSGLDLTRADAVVADFKQNRLAWADAFEEARERRVELERQSLDLFSPQEKAASLDASIQECQALVATLDQKEAELTRQMAANDQSVQAEAEALLAQPLDVGRNP